MVRVNGTELYKYIKEQSKDVEFLEEKEILLALFAAQHLQGYHEFHSGIYREVCEFNPAQKAYSVFWECIWINHTGMFKNLLQETDPAYGLCLSSPCFAVSCVLAPVPLCAGPGDLRP